MGGYRNLDAFTKTRPDLQQKSAVGGIITLVAASSAALLFVAQIISYIVGNTQHSLHLANSVSAPLLPLSKVNQAFSLSNLPLKIHVTFPHLSCEHIDVTLDGASLASGELEKIHGKQSLGLKPTSASELRRLGVKSRSRSGTGCTVQGKLRPQLVAGVLAISVTQAAWTQATNKLAMQGLSHDQEAINSHLSHLNVSHYIHQIQFGRNFQKANDLPLKNRAHWIDNTYGGIAVEHITVKLVPTVYRSAFFTENTYQMSVTDHTINPETLIGKGVPYMPGLALTYDFSPLEVHHSEGRDNIIVFLSSLVSIVGGAFVTVRLFTGFLVHSAQAVAKKID